MREVDEVVLVMGEVKIVRDRATGHFNIVRRNGDVIATARTLVEAREIAKRERRRLETRAFIRAALGAHTRTRQREKQP